MHRKDLPLVLISVSSILSGVAALWGDPSFWGKVIFILQFDEFEGVASSALERFPFMDLVLNVVEPFQNSLSLFSVVPKIWFLSFKLQACPFFLKFREVHFLDKFVYFLADYGDSRGEFLHRA